MMGNPAPIHRDSALVISEEQMLHGRPWRGEEVRGWYASEKLDGCCGYGDGARMWSRDSDSGGVER